MDDSMQRTASAGLMEQAMMSRVPEEVRQARQAGADRLASMTAGQLQALRLGRHLLAAARMLREQAGQGLSPAEVFAAMDAAELKTLQWLLAEAGRAGLEGGMP